MRLTIRVLVVDDSALIRQMLTRALSLDPRIEIVGTAKTGVEAIEKVRELDPDVVTLDIEMPELTGLEALPHIRRCSKARVVMLSSFDDPDTTYRALSLGAVDFISKPSAGMASSITELSELVLKKIKTAYRITAEQASAAAEASILHRQEPEALLGSVVPGRKPTGIVACVAVAASTGGPPALERMFSGLSASLPAAYLVVQHLPFGFSASLARRLSGVCDIPVVEAEDGMQIKPGCGYVAPYGAHMAVRRSAVGATRIRLIDSPPIHGLRPAADPLFESVAHAFGDHAIGVVLSGMGEDGARGAVAIKKAGGDTIVQDEATSVVWGMPGATVRLDGARRIVPLGLVSVEVRRSVRGYLEGGLKPNG